MAKIRITYESQRTFGDCLEHWRCITPLNLLEGQELKPLCSWSQVRGSAPTKRLNYLQRKADEFWTIYRTDVLPQLLRAGKWNQKDEPLMVGDVVLVENPNPLERPFCPGRIISLEKGSKTAICRFKLNSSSPTENYPVNLRRLFRVDLQTCEA